MKNRKRVISLICTIVLLLSNCSILASAQINDISQNMSSSENTEDNLTYRDVDYVIPGTKSKYSANYSSSKPDVTVPSSYDMRVSDSSSLTPVRNQNPYGTCWAFSAMASAETNLAKKGLADNTIDLSELQLAYFMYHQNEDPLGNSTGDYNYISNGDTIIDMGGNTMYTTYTLARWIGATAESTVPYEDAAYAVGADYSSSIASDMDYAHLQNAYWINMTKDPESVKAFVMTNGAVGTAYFEDHSSWNSSGTAYFQNQKQYTNHAVAIVGWDDNYSKSNFKSTCQPTKDGAWLIRNSWGESAGDGGYFWLSYEDSSIYDQSAFVFDMESSDNYDHNYQYDGSSSIGSLSLSGYSAANVCNVFTSQNDENLEAIAFSNPRNTNVEYTVKIYLNPTDSSNPTSGTLISAATTTGTETYAGYHTIKLNAPVSLKKGDVFAVAIELCDTQGEDINLAFDSNYDYGWIACKSVAEAGQSFYSFNGGYSWRDLTTYKANSNMRIKAFTNETGLDSPSGLTASVNSEDLVTMSWNSVDGATSYDIYAQSEKEDDYTKVANVSATSYSYTPEYSDGTSVFYKVMARNDTQNSAFSLGTGIRMPVTVPLRGFDFEITDWTTVADSVDLAIGDTQSTTVNFYNNGGDKTMAFYSENTKIATISPTGLITATGSGTVTIHAVARYCTDEYGRDKTITVNVPEDIIVTDIQNMQSGHPYAAGIDKRYIYKVEGATSISMTFSSETNVVPGNDKIRIYNKNNTLVSEYSGNTLAGKTVKVTGDTFIVRLQSRSGSYYGFKVTDVALEGSLVDKSALEGAINSYASLKQSDYTPASWSTYTSALSDARAVMGDITATAEAVENAKTALDNAVIALSAYINISDITITANGAVKIDDKYFITVPENVAFDNAGVQLNYTLSPDGAMYKSKAWTNDSSYIGVDDSDYASPYWDFFGDDILTLTLTDDFGNTYTGDITLFFVHHMADKVTLSDSSLPMLINSSKTLTASITDNSNHESDYNEITWTSSNENVATVENGVVTAVGAGSAKIRVTADNTGVYSECAVTVTTENVETVTLSDNTLSMIAGDSGSQITASVSDSLGATHSNVTWTSSDNSVATVVNGLVTPVGKGTAKITATSTKSAAKAECAITVEENTETVALSAKTLSKIAGESAVTLTATVTDKLGNKHSDVTFKSSAPTVASVSSDGTVTFLSKGTAIITVTSTKSAAKAECAVTVEENTETVALSAKTLSKIAGESAVKLTATVTDKLGNKHSDVTFKSSAPTVASVSSDGTVTFLSKGTATITVTSTKSATKAECTVTVAENTKSVVISETSATLKLGGNDIQLTAKVVDRLGNESTNIAWISSDESIAAVSDNGYVTAISEGTVTITAKDASSDAYAVCSVTVEKEKDVEYDPADTNKDGKVSFFEKLAAFFRGIAEFFKNLFSRG